MRAQYDYAGRYFVSGSYRRDASSRFHPDHRWGNFWSVGAAWLLNQENWFDAPWVNMLKLKASYGSQGNDNIGNGTTSTPTPIRSRTTTAKSPCSSGRKAIPTLRGRPTPT